MPSLSHFPALPVSPSSMQQLTSYTTFFLSPEGTTISLHFQRRYFLILAGHPYITRSSKSSWCSVCISRCFLCVLQLIFFQKGLTRNKSPRSRGSKVRKDFSFWSVLDTFQVKVFHDLSSRFLIPSSFPFHSLLPSFDYVA